MISVPSQPQVGGRPGEGPPLTYKLMWLSMSFSISACIYMRILNLHAKIVFLNTATIVIIYLSLTMNTVYWRGKITWQQYKCWKDRLPGHWMIERYMAGKWEPGLLGAASTAGARVNSASSIARRQMLMVRTHTVGCRFMGSVAGGTVCGSS